MDAAAQRAIKKRLLNEQVMGVVALDGRERFLLRRFLNFAKIFW